MAVSDRAPLAGDRVGDADLAHALDQLVGGLLDVDQVAVDFHLAAGLGQRPHGAQLVVQAAQLLHGHLGQGLGVQQRTLHARLQRGVHDRVVLGHGLHIGQRGFLEPGCDVVGPQDGAHRVDHVRITATLDDLFVVALGHALEELEDLAHLDLGVLQRLDGGVVEHLVALGLHGLLGLALTRGLLPALAGARLSAAVLPSGVFEVLDASACGQVGGELLGRVGDRVDRDGSATHVGAAGVLARVQHLGLTLELGGQ